VTCRLQIIGCFWWMPALWVVAEGWARLATVRAVVAILIFPVPVEWVQAFTRLAAD